MKTIILTAAAVMLALPALADNRATRAIYTLPQYVELVGCKIVDMGGYSNVQSADGGFCEGMKGYVVQPGTVGVTVRQNFDPDGIAGSGDEFSRERRERARDNN